jgi:hypothetical protein
MLEAGELNLLQPNSHSIHDGVSVMLAEPPERTSGGMPQQEVRLELGALAKTRDDHKSFKIHCCWRIERLGGDVSLVSILCPSLAKRDLTRQKQTKISK